MQGFGCLLNISKILKISKIETKCNNTDLAHIKNIFA